MTGDKRKRDDFSGYKLNANLALDKQNEGMPFSELVDQSPLVLQGIGEKSAGALSKAGINTIGKLARWKYYHISKSLLTLSTTEESNLRPQTSQMNCDNALDKAHHAKSLRSIVDEPVSALKGLTQDHADLLKALHIKSIRDLAESRYFMWAESIVTLASTEVLYDKPSKMHTVEEAC